MYRDLRHWLSCFEECGELKRVDGVSCDLEMSGVWEILAREGKGPIPALLFDNIPAYPKGYRTLFGLLASPSRLAMCLGLSQEQGSRLSLVKSWRTKMGNLQPLPPKVVASGPVKAHVLTGDEIDLSRFPAPRFHELDGGRYIGTCHGVIIQDPDSGWVNVGTYRVMVVDRGRLALHMVETQHGRILWDKMCNKRRQPMPVAIAIGMEPALWFASSVRLPWGISEYDYAGGIQGEPVEVMPGPCLGLPIPAHAEIVIEGECLPGELTDEGPFGESLGYYANLGLSPVPEPTVRVKAILFRDDPILTCAHPSKPPHDYGLMGNIRHAARIWDILEKSGVPGIAGVWCHEIAGGALFTVISIQQVYAGQSKQAGLIASQLANTGRYTVVVDDDIDPSSLNDVIWALATRSDPERSIEILRYCPTTSADPAVSPREKRKTKLAPKPLYSSRAVIDACRPYEWKDEFYPVAQVSNELRLQLLDKWGHLFKEFLPDA
ncbi:MAG: UbiD family decarboxylase [Deltaproteobacteria bacterium]|nr:UbiD family decarboxylase [Deltaproteobacteria bacterium]